MSTTLRVRMMMTEQHRMALMTEGTRAERLTQIPQVSSKQLLREAEVAADHAAGKACFPERP